ncbi:MAG: hypothetical protein IJ106_11580 [Parasporobacterium sp.]|nr:hypothetical protein [Parasporobacterium sp.]
MTKRKEKALSVLRGNNENLVPCFFQDYQLMFIDKMGERPPMGVLEGFDAWGVHQTATTNTGGAFTPTPSRPFVLEDVTEWEETVHFPDYDQVDWEEEARKLEESGTLNREEKVLDIFCANGLFERMHFLMGLENTCVSLLTEPEACMDLIAKIADTKIRLIHGALPFYQPDVYTFLDDYAHARGLFISKELFRSMFKPHLKRIVDAVHEEGVLCKLHCCGKMEDLAQDYREIGVDALDPVQPLNDIPAMQRLFENRIGLMGGLDVTGVIDNMDAGEEDIRAEVRRCMDTYGPQGGYTMYCASTQLRSPGAFDPDGVFGILLDEYRKHPLSRV